MQKNEQQKNPHSVILEERKTLRVTGVVDVEEFDETRVCAMLEGSSFDICGKNLRVLGFSAESGELSVEGEIDSLSYSAPFSKKAGIIARIFR